MRVIRIQVDFFFLDIKWFRLERYYTEYDSKFIQQPLYYQYLYILALCIFGKCRVFIVQPTHLTNLTTQSLLYFIVVFMLLFVGIFEIKKKKLGKWETLPNYNKSRMLIFTSGTITFRWHWSYQVLEKCC